MTRVAVLGAKGRMGTASIEALTAAGLEVVAKVDVDDSIEALARRVVLRAGAALRA